MANIQYKPESEKLKDKLLNLLIMQAAANIIKRLFQVFVIEKKMDLFKSHMYNDGYSSSGIYVYVYMFIYLHVFISIYMYTYMYVYIYTYIHMHMYTSIYIYIYIITYMYISMFLVVVSSFTLLLFIGY
jgi:hypothetical protein